MVTENDTTPRGVPRKRKAQGDRQTHASPQDFPPLKNLATPGPTTSRCIDCSSPDVGWWVGRWKANAGAARNRCHPCYLDYARRVQSGDKAGTKPRREQPLTVDERRARMNEYDQQRRPRTIRSCIDCQTDFHPKSQGERCSTCSLEYRALTKSSQAARRLLAERNGDKGITWQALVERDGPDCHLCGKPVHANVGVGYQPLGGSVDHLAPLADGGEHVWSNVALAHRKCNISRGARGLVQLRLVG